MSKNAKDRFQEMKQAMEHGLDTFSGESPATMEREQAEAGVGGLKIAVIVADGFEQREFDGPVEALRKAGAKVEVLAPDERHLAHIKGVYHFEQGAGTKGDRVISDAKPEDYDGLLIPGGLASPDTMRQSQVHLNFVTAFMEANKPVASICHAAWLLADADQIQGRKLTSWPGIRRDVERAGGTWSDHEVIHDGNLVTSRNPHDVPAFSKAFISLLAATRKR